MILMVNGETGKFIVDQLEEVNIMECIYYMDRNMQVFEARDKHDYPHKTYKFSKVFAPKKDTLTNYEEMQIEDVDNPKATASLCEVKGLYILKRGKDKGEIVIIHPAYEAYLCNDQGKTIEKIY